MNLFAQLGRAKTMASADFSSLCANRACLADFSEEELRDFCSLLALADRVLIASPDADTTATRLLGVCLDELGFLAQIVDARTMKWVQPSDTVVAIWGSERGAALRDLLRPALETRAVLLALTVRRPSALLRLADGAITIPPRSAGPQCAGHGSPQANFDLMSIIAVDAIRRDLSRRREVTPLLGVPSAVRLLPKQLPTQ